MPLPEPSFQSIIASTATDIYPVDDVNKLVGDDKNIIVEPDNTYTNEIEKPQEEPEESETIKDENSEKVVEDQKIDEENDKDNETEEKPKNSSSSAHKKFAEMRTQVRDLRKENDELKKAAPKETAIPEELTKELDQLRDIVKAYAVKNSPEYIKEVIQPHKHGSDTLHNLASTYSVEIDYTKIEEICVNEELTKAQREDTYEDLGIEMGIPDARLVKFVRACMEIDTATELNAKYTSEGDKFKEEFIQKLIENSKGEVAPKEEVTKEIDTSSLTTEALDTLIKKYGVTGLDVEEINKTSQEKAKSGSLEDYHKAAVLEAVSAKLTETTGELEKALKRIEKLKSSRPSAATSAKKSGDTLKSPTKIVSIESMVSDLFRS